MRTVHEPWVLPLVLGLAVVFPSCGASEEETPCFDSTVVTLRFGSASALKPGVYALSMRASVQGSEVEETCELDVSADPLASSTGDCTTKGASSGATLVAISTEPCKPLERDGASGGDCTGRARDALTYLKFGTSFEQLHYELRRDAQPLQVGTIDLRAQCSDCRCNAGVVDITAPP